jgi:hypothetical protein
MCRFVSAKSRPLVAGTLKRDDPRVGEHGIRISIPCLRASSGGAPTIDDNTRCRIQELLRRGGRICTRKDIHLLRTLWDSVEAAVRGD